MAQRFEIGDVVDIKKSAQGQSSMIDVRAIGAGLTVTVKDLSGNNLTVYQAETGSPTFSNPLTSDSGGRIEGWVDAPDFDLAISGTGVTTYTQKVRQSPPGTFCAESYGSKGDNSTDNQTALAALVAALPASGGRVTLNGIHRHSGTLNFDDKRSVLIEGTGGHSGGADTAAQLVYTGTGTGYSCRSTAGFRTKDVWLRFNNASHSGTLIDFGHSAGLNIDSQDMCIEGMVGSGTAATQGTGTLMSLDKAINGDFSKAKFQGGNVAVRGKASAGTYSNHHNFDGATFVYMKSTPVRNAGQSWKLGATFQQLYPTSDTNAPGGAGAYVDESGFSSIGLDFSGAWMGDAATKAVTGASSTDIFTATAHGLVAGDTVAFTGLTGGAGISTTIVYYVIAANLTADAFQVSTVAGGAALNFTTDLTAGTLRRGTWITAAGNGLKAKGANILTGARGIALGSSSQGAEIDSNFESMTVGVEEGANGKNNNTDGSTFTSVTTPRILDASTYIERYGLPSCKVYSSANFDLVDTTEVSLNWDSEEWDRGGMHSTSSSTNRLSAPIEGVYMATLYLPWGTGTTGRRVAKIRANGAGQLAQEIITASVSPQQVVSATVKLLAGEWVEARASHTQGVNLAISGGAGLATFSLVYIGSSA